MDFDALKNSLQEATQYYEFQLADQKHLVVGVVEQDTLYEITFAANWDELVLHWGLGTNRAKEWKSPSLQEGLELPKGSQQFDHKATQTPFNSTNNTLKLCIPKEVAPKQINFVVKRGDTWFNNNNRDFALPVCFPSGGACSNPVHQNIVDQIIDAEMSDHSWTLMHRFQLCNDLLKQLSKEDLEGLAWVFVWMRYSELRKLVWQRKYGVRPRLLAESQKNLTYTLTEMISKASGEGLVSPLVVLRNTLKSFGKGGDHGQRIRDQILEVMHKNGLKEIHGTYYEQWHQKLHNNTTPDDIGICKAIIAFNETQDMNKYWEVLNAHGITRERLESFDRPITCEPFAVPHALPDFYDYLKLLKSVHESTDLVSNVEHVRPFASQEVHSQINELLGNLEHFDKITQMERATNLRHSLLLNTNRENIGQFREVVYLDMSLESYIRTLCESILHYDIELKHRMRELSILVDNVALLSTNKELKLTYEDWKRFRSLVAENLNQENALIIKAQNDRLFRILGNFVDDYNSLIEPKAQHLGIQFEVDQASLKVFTEEVIRGSLVFAVSLILRKIDSKLRSIIGIQSWQIISPVYPLLGYLKRVDSLQSVAYEKYESSTVLIADKVTGEEDIPEGVVGVISGTELDALAHVSVRARNSKVLLAVCFDSEKIRQIDSLEGEWVELTASAGEISVQKTHKTQEAVEELKENTQVKKPKPMQKLVISSQEFNEGVTGAKANNCSVMASKLPKEIRVPRAVALPYGVCEYVVSQNSEIEVNIQNLMQELQSAQNSHIPKVLGQLKQEVMKLQVSQSDKETILHELNTLGIKDQDWEEAWTAIKSVWASKYNERAYLSTLKAGISLNDVYMSTLCQEVICGDYSFVLHTKNPFNNNSREIYGELVIGLGEVLVGAYEGRAFSFVVNKDTSDFKVEAFPNKSVALKGSGFIFRSDSNSEDLEDFAGAGLFDSFIMKQPQEELLTYAQEKLYLDAGFRREVVMQLKDLGIKVETAFEGFPQDIEGVITQEGIYVVQSRPQV